MKQATDSGLARQGKDSGCAPMDRQADRRMDRQAAMRKAVASLSRREHSAFELRRKLERSGISAELATEVIVELQRQDLQSDDRFAEAFIRYRSGKGYGPQRIEMEMNEKGIDRSLISLAMENNDCNWSKLANEVNLKKFGSGQPATYKERARQARFLQYRGFTGEQIRFALGESEGDL